MDHHVHGAITRALRRRDVDVLTAEEDGRAARSDLELLSRADELQRLFFSFDEDLPREAHRRQATGEHFFGLAFAHEWSITIGQAIESLELICKVNDPSDVENQVVYLPL